MSTVIERQLPADLEAERATLGALLIDRDAVVAVAPWLFADYFYLEKHAWIYEAVLECYNRRIPPDVRTVSDALRRNNRLDPIGGIPYLVELSAATPTAVHIEYYARIVERTALLRRLIQAGGQIAALGYDERNELEATLDKAEETLFNVSQRRTNADFVHIGQVVDSFFEQINYLQEHRGDVVGLATRFRDLDELTGGLQKSDLIILAARPSVGKTAYALQLAYNVSLHSRGSVGIFSLEMSREQLVQRILAMHTGIDSQKLRSGSLRESDLQQITEGMGVLSSVPLYIDDTPGLTISEVRSKSRRLQAEAGVDLLIIDYLQLMQGRSRDNRVNEISEISRGLKALARELDVPVIALSQLSRAVETRTSHVPMLSDLRESGCLTGESLVYLPDEGVYQRIDQLVGKRSFRVLALNTETWKLEPRPVLNVFSTGRKPVFKLTTRLKRSIRATGNHKFLTIYGWKCLDELQIGERITMPRQLPGPDVVTMSDSELALLGHLIGDGCTLARQPIHYTTNELALAELVAELATDIFGNAVKPRVSYEHRWYQVYLAATSRLTHGVRNPVAIWLNELGIFDLRSHEKRVPDRVFRQPKAGIAKFLRHLWATDGCIHLSATKSHYASIYYASSSWQLAQHVQSLLLRLDINAILSCSPQFEKGRDQYRVTVSGKDDISTFFKCIGGLGQNKQQHQATISELFNGKVANTNRDVIPREVWRMFAVPAMREAGITTRQMQASLGNAYCGTALYKQNMSRERAGRLADVVQSEAIARLATSDVYWDEIVSIEPDGEEDVYDLTVEELHNFVANNIIVHNSIEQDADIVIFIYREELYDKNTDKQGIAELHIAKHRNGPIGVVPLRFDKSINRFVDLERYRQPEGY